MSRGSIFIAAALIAFIAIYFGGPFVRRALNAIVGNSLQTRVKILAAEDDPNCQTQKGDEKVPKTVLEMEIYFPMDAAPENADALNVIDESNQPVEVYWSPVEKEDLPDLRLTRWHFREAYFPMGFRQGTLREKSKELTYFKVPQVPFNVTPQPNNQ